MDGETIDGKKCSENKSDSKSFSKHIDTEKMLDMLKKSKIKKELKDQVEILIDILFCNEKIIGYRSSINYFLEKLIEQCPTCNKYEYRIKSASPKDGNNDFYICSLLCNKCKTHSIEIILPFKLIQSYCNFHNLTPPVIGEAFENMDS